MATSVFHEMCENDLVFHAAPLWLLLLSCKKSWSVDWCISCFVFEKKLKIVLIPDWYFASSHTKTAGWNLVDMISSLAQSSQPLTHLTLENGKTESLPPAALMCSCSQKWSDPAELLAGVREGFTENWWNYSYRKFSSSLLQKLVLTELLSRELKSFPCLPLTVQQKCLLG